MKKIINKPEGVVDEMVRGIALAHGSLEYLSKYRVLKKLKINPKKVSLISGGGSGHEPAHAGFVGRGMLDAAVCGDVFASPSQIQIYQAITATASEAGTLLIIKNYSGDIMNFQNGAVLAGFDGLTIDSIKVADDIAVMDSLYTVGRRGVAGTVLVHKIAGAAAEEGKDLSEVKRIAQKAADSVRSVGFAFSSCVVPAKGTQTFAIEEGEMEYGVGIHGEPGIRREKVLSANELAKRMTTSLVDELAVQSGKEVAVLINGFGATPLMELYVLNNCVMRELAEQNIPIYRNFVGNYMTSIDMMGASVSIMVLDDELKTFLAAPCNAPAFQVTGTETSTVYTAPVADKTDQDGSFPSSENTGDNVIHNNQITRDNMVFLIDKMGDVIIENEIPFCELDAHAGDGDFGMSVAKGFKQLKREWARIMAEESANISSFLNACSLVIMEYCGGASGPI